MSTLFSHRNGISRRKQVRQERGVALVLALLCLMILSLLAMGMISSTQSEIWTTANYRQASQARYIAEAGAERAVNWLSSSQFVTNVANSGLSGASFNLTTSPAVYTGNTACASGCIIRMTSSGSAMAGGITDTVSTFDNTAKLLETNFASALGPSHQDFSAIAGSSVAYYTVSAQLVEAFYSTAASGWVTKWKITSQGTVGAVHPTTVQVVELVENMTISTTAGNPPMSSWPYGLFATSASCGAVTINGGSSVVSYDSSKQLGVASPTWTYSSGNVGTMGNVSLTGGAYLYGSVYAPGYNLGNTSASVYYPYGVSGGGAWPYNNGSEACSSSKMYAVNEDNSGSAIQCTNSTSNCTNKASQLPSTYTTSTYSSAATMVGSTAVTVPTNTATCSYSVICSGGSGYYSSSLGQYVSSVTLPPSTTTNVVNYGAATFAGSTTVTLNAGSYFFDTLTMTAGATMSVGSSPVVVYIQNTGSSTQPLNFTGGAFSNAGSDPNNLTFVYNGTQTVHIGSISSNTLFATIYAPNAKIVFDGNGSIYGAVIGKTVSITGGGHVIYDTHLGSSTTHVYPPGGSSTVVTPLHVTNFSWSVY